MAHPVHTTQAIVLGSADTKEADKTFWLLTDEHGLLIAQAKSIREETSKLRYVLQDLACVRVSLVRGKALWRITGAEEGNGNALKHPALFGRIAALVRRMTPADEYHTDVFVIVQNARTALAETKYPKTLEIVAVARILFVLGYLRCTEAYTGIVDADSCNEELLMNARKLEKHLIADINSGLAQSQL